MPEQSHKEVISLSRVRLASTRGHIVIIEPTTPTRIPAALFLEAAKKGCVDYNPQMIEAFKFAMAKAAQAEGSEPNANETSPIEPMKFVKDSVRQVLAAGASEPELLTAQGLPRLPAVRAAFDAMCGEAHVDTDVKVTTELIGTIYLEIQEELKPTPALTARYPSGVPQGDLEGEEAGGLDEATLERLSQIKE
jgi:hypothetical protein